QGNTQVSGITVGIRRLGFAVVSSTPPRTGFCRIAGSATCSFLSLNGHETQTYTLTLRAQATGTYTLHGWTTQPSTGRGFGAAVPVTVTSCQRPAWPAAAASGRALPAPRVMVTVNAGLNDALLAHSPAACPPRWPSRRHLLKSVACPPRRPSGRHL